MSAQTSDGRAGIDAALVTRLVSAQFPQWADLPVTPVEPNGNDNRTYRLGADLTVRLPTAAGYVPGVDKEDRWLPLLAPHLPAAIPAPVARGAPGPGYPFPWSIRRWLDGEPAALDGIVDLERFGRDLARFLAALQHVDTADGPAAGAHSFFRGASLAHYDEETRRALEDVSGSLDTQAALSVWETALGSIWPGPPVWFHGDIATGNLLVRDGRLTAVIDFGTCGVGDPACDLVIAWTFLSGGSRDAFRATVDLDEATWERARGWALWKAVITMANADEPAVATSSLRVVEEILADA